MAIQTVVVSGACPLPGDTVPASAFLEFTLSGFDTDATNIVAPEPVTVELVDGALPGGFSLWANEAGLRGTYYTVKLNVTDLQTMRITRHPLGNIQIASAPASQSLASLLNNPVPSVPSWNVNLDSETYDFLIQDVAAAKAATQPGATTNTQLAPIPSGRIKGRVSDGNGTVEDLTAAQVRAFLGVLFGAQPTDVSTLNTVFALLDPGMVNRIRDLYEAADGRNPFTDALKAKLDGIQGGAQVTNETTVSAAIGEAPVAGPLALIDTLGVKQADASGALRRVTVAKLRDALEAIINLNNVPDTASFMRMTAAERAKLAALRPETIGYYASRAALLTDYANLPDGALTTVGDAGFERATGAMTFPDMPGFVPARALSKPAIWHWQRHGDGIQDNTATFDAIKEFTTTSGQRVDMGSGGTYLTNQILIGSAQALRLEGDPLDRPRLLLGPATNSNVINTVEDGDAKIDLYGLVIDGQRAIRENGHGIRSAGASMIHLDQVLIQHCQSYGLGVQRGINRDIRIGFLEVMDVGMDAVDFKNTSFLNDPVFFDHIKCSAYGDRDTDKVAFDVRGAVYGRFLECDVPNTGRGMRFRTDGLKSGSDIPQGPAGYGYIHAINARGTAGDAATGVGGFAVQFSGSDPRAVVGTIIGDNIAGLILQETTSKGGTVLCVRGNNVYRQDAITLKGEGLEIMSGYISKHPDAATVDHVVDITGTALRNDIRNLKVYDPRGFARPILIEPGATDNRLFYPTVVSANAADNGIEDLGTNTGLIAPRSFAA